MLRRAKLPKNGSCETFLEKWYRDDMYRKSLSDKGWAEEKIRQYDALALEDHSYEATPEDKRRWEKNNNDLIFVKRRTLFVDYTKNMLKEPDKEISQSIQHNKEGKILNNNLMNTRSTPTRFTLEQDGDIILQHVRHHPRSGSRTMNGSRVKVGIIGDLQRGLNSKIFKVEIISIGEPVASRQEMIPTNSF